jgi:hypothetical protein
MVTGMIPPIYPQEQQSSGPVYQERITAFWLNQSLTNLGGCIPAVASLFGENASIIIPQVGNFTGNYYNLLLNI